MNSHEIIKKLKQDGWYQVSTTGSHTISCSENILICEVKQQARGNRQEEFKPFSLNF